jgi:transposase
MVARRKLSRAKLLEWLANQGPCRIGMEACCGAHHLARQLAAQGHDVRLMPAQYVKPFVKTHKNDTVDAEACAEAVQRPQRRFVPIKSREQLDVQALHRARDRPAGVC